MKTGLFLRTYQGDAEFLGYALQSIKDNVTVDEIVVVCPTSSWWTIKCVTDNFEGVRLDSCDDYLNDYRGQKVTKAHADQFFSDDVNVIMMTDSDTLFLQPVSISDFVEEDKIVVPVSYYSELNPEDKDATLNNWEVTTSSFVNRAVDLEFMRRQPLVYWRHTLKLFRDFCHTQHNSTIHGLVEPDKEPFKHGLPDVKTENLSIYNAIGAFCYFYQPDEYSFVDDSKVPLKGILQLWSWSDMDVPDVVGMADTSHLTEPQLTYCRNLFKQKTA